MSAYALDQDCPPAAANAAVAKGGVSWKTAARFGDDWRGWMIALPGASLFDRHGAPAQ